MTAIVLDIPARREQFKVGMHPPPKTLSGISGASVRLTVPPMHWVEVTLGPMTRAESAKLAGQIAAARTNEVLVQIPDAAPAYGGAGLTVSSVSGLALTLSGWSGTWQDGKRLSITRGSRRYLVPTTGGISSGVVQMANAPRVTFVSGDVVAYNNVLLQGLLEDSEQLVEQIGRRGVTDGVVMRVREML